MVKRCHEQVTKMWMFVIQNASQMIIGSKYHAHFKKKHDQLNQNTSLLRRWQWTNVSATINHGHRFAPEYHI